MVAYANNYGDHYFATKEQYRGKGDTIYVVCPRGADELKEKVKDAEVVTIYLDCNRENREKRMREDGRSEKNIQERLEEDIELFKEYRSDYRVDANKERDEVVQEIMRIIQEV